MAANHIRMLCSVIKVDLVYEEPDVLLTAFFDSVQDSPLMQDAQLRQMLREGLDSQGTPFLLPCESGIYFAVLRAGEGYLYMGPMCSEKLTAVQRRQMYASYGISGGSARHLPVFTLTEIRNMILLTNSALNNTNLENEELMQLNQFLNEKGKQAHKEQTEKEQTKYVLDEEEANDDAAFRHSYYEEQLLMQAIREGREKDAVRLAQNMDSDSGRLASREVSHWHNLAIIGIALCTRAAIEGGIPPETGYRLSGYYIQKCEKSQDPAHLLHYRNRAIEELTLRVKEKLEHAHSSSHVERCKDYVRKHYREKLYLDDIAGILGISPTYLSRLFRQETGQRLQDFINEERVYRASNLLKYSDLSISQIAEYVHFPSQSYFGKIFKQFKQVSPRVFREQYLASQAADR